MDPVFNPPKQIGQFIPKRSQTLARNKLIANKKQNNVVSNYLKNDKVVLVQAANTIKKRMVLPIKAKKMASSQWSWTARLLLDVQYSQPNWLQRYVGAS